MGFNTKNLSTFGIVATIGFATIIATGCSYKTDCYTPLKKQNYEEKVCYKYNDPLFANSRFVHMDNTLWMQYDYHYIIEARDFNVTVNDENETHIATKFLVLPSDHPLEKFSNLLINVNFLRSYDKINSLSYTPLNPNSEMGRENLWGMNLWALNRFIDTLKTEENTTTIPKKEELNSSK
jgi:hypothetical protein